MPPEVKVRLSVEGTPEAIAAFKAVQAQAHSTAAASAKSFNLFNKALSGVKTMLVGMVGAFALGKLAQLGREAMDTTERIGNLAEELGTSVEELSSLAVVAKLADSDLETLAGTMGILAKNVDALKSGSPTAVAAFARLGLSARDFASQDTARWFETVALKMDKVAAGGSRTAVALALMGRNGRAALPIMKGLADVGGLLGARSQAEKMGLLIDAQTLANVRALSDEMKVLNMEASGAALAFIRGFGPFALQNMRAMSDSVGSTAEYFRSMGEFLGRVLSVLRAIALTVVLPVGLTIANMVVQITGVIRVADAVLHGRWRRALYEISLIPKQMLSVTGSALRDVGRAWAMIGGQPAPLPSVPSPSGRGEEAQPRAAARADAATAQRLARQKAAIEDELRATKDGLFREEEAAKQSYERGRIALDDYYAKRREVVEKGLAAELKALEGERALAQQETDPERRATQLQAIATRAAATAREAEAQLADITSEETDAINGLTERALEFQKKLLEAQGKTHEARMLDIALEASAYRQLLGQMGLDPALIEQMIEEYKAALIHADQTAKRTSDLQETLGSTLGSWLGSTINQVESLTDAFRSLALAIAQAVQQLLAMEIAKTIVSWIPGMTPVKKAGGGLIVGPGTGSSDSIPALLSAGEYVVRAAAVQQPGILPLLEDLNRATRPAQYVARFPHLDPGYQMRHFAAGGLVSGADRARLAGGSGGEIGGRMTLELAEGLVVRHTEAYFKSRSGEKAVLQIIARNRRQVKGITG